MNFTYEGTGGITLGCCASPITVTKRFQHKFGVGEVAYVKETARAKRKLEPVTIKIVERRFSSTPASHGIQPVFMYTDTFNMCWMEEELVWQAEAVDLAILHWELIAAQAEQLIVNC